MGVGRGLACLPQAARLLLRSRRLRWLSALPAALSVLLLVVLVWAAVTYVPWLTGLIGWTAGWVVGLVTVGVVLLAIPLSFYGSLLILEPFIDWLSEATEVVLKSGCEPPGGLRAMVHDSLLVVVDIAADLLRFALAQIVVLLTWLTPFSAWLHPLLAFIVTAWFTGVAMTCGPLVRRGYRGRARWRYMGARRGPVFGLGAGAAALALIPFAQLLTVPLSVIAGTILIVGFDEPAPAQSDAD